MLLEFCKRKVHHDYLYIVFLSGQGGYSHINCRTFEYVKNVFEKLGFDHDPESSQLLKNASTLGWLRKNTNVYRRRDVGSIDLSNTWKRSFRDDVIV